MTDFDRRLSEADPLQGEDLSRFVEHREDLIEAILESSEAADFRASPARKPRSRSLRLGIAAGVVCALVFAVLIVRGGTDSDDSSAWAAELVAFAESSPRVLIDQPGWEVNYVDELGVRQGFMSFVNEDGPAQVELSWNGQPAENRIRALEFSSRLVAADVPVLGTEAKVFERGRYKRLKPFISAVPFEGRTLVLRAVASDPDWFVEVLSSLKKVDVDTWLSALPPTAIRAVDRDPVVEEMLREIPLPEGFRSRDIPDADLLKDRYQLGVNVAGSVTCAWFRQWATARRDGDLSGADDAVSAVGTSKDWPVLLEMEKTGDYPQVIWQFADAIADGPTFFGRPLLGEVNQGLGCPRLGIDLEQLKTKQQNKEKP